MNHCILEVLVKTAPTVRFTQDNKTPIGEKEVFFEGLRPDDSPGELKVVGWGNMAQDLQAHVQIGQKLILEGRLRMNTLPRQDGTKEKRAELTLSKLHTFSEIPKSEDRSHEIVTPNSISNPSMSNPENSSPSKQTESLEESVNWNSSPLVPDTDEIPF